MAVAFSNGGKDSSWINFDITPTIQGFVKDSIENHGFMFEVYIEARYMTVCSSEESNVSIRPKLTICYDNNPIEVIYNTANLQKEIKIKKAAQSYMIYIPYNSSHLIAIYDISGREITSFNTHSSKQWYTLPQCIPPGMHIIRISTPDGIAVKKLDFLQ